MLFPPPRPEPEPQPEIPQQAQPAEPPAEPAFGPFQRGSLRLFRLAGIDVFVHWSWFLVAYFRIDNRVMEYTSYLWNVAEYLLVFGVVLLHEFGHVLACRQVGGTADKVVLWPLGGLALVNPPPRPGALLWTTAAGPLVNLLLVPLAFGLLWLSGFQGWNDRFSDLDSLIFAFAVFNVVMLIFNLLPIYPLDGGQILQALLWFVVGRARSLMVVSVIGVLAGLGLLAFAAWSADVWFAVMAVFLVVCALGGFAHARLLDRILKAPRHLDRACPACGTPPPIGEFWRCTQCFKLFDLFAPDQSCPKGGEHESEKDCFNCGREFDRNEWVLTPQPSAPES